MRKPRWRLALVVLVGLLSLVAADGVAASEAPIPPIVQPKIMAVSSTAVCPVLPCQVTAMLTYNVGVGFTRNAAGDFTMADLTLRKVCVTQSLTPSPILVGGTNLLMLTATCTVNQGDKMAIRYRQDPATLDYVYSLRAPKVAALSPQVVQWAQGSVFGCPPLCVLVP
jgi:hypothetical protein